MALEVEGLLIGGEQRASCSGESFEVLAPADGRVIARVARGGADDVELAVATARRGFATWSALAPKEREAVLLAAADLVEREGEQRHHVPLPRQAQQSLRLPG